MPYIKNGVYPITEAQIRATHPNVSFPQQIVEANVAPFGYVLVTPSVKPADTHLVTYSEGAPLAVGQGYVQQWAETPRQAADTIKVFEQAVQDLLDTTAQSRNYDGILSAVTYADSAVPTFAAEGQAMKAWRDACWAKCYQVLAAVQAGQRAVPTVEELLAELPAVTLP